MLDEDDLDYDVWAAVDDIVKEHQAKTGTLATSRSQNFASDDDTYNKSVLIGQRLNVRQIFLGPKGTHKTIHKQDAKCSGEVWKDKSMPAPWSVPSNDNAPLSNTSLPYARYAHNVVDNSGRRDNRDGCLNAAQHDEECIIHAQAYPFFNGYKNACHSSYQAVGSIESANLKHAQKLTNNNYVCLAAIQNQAAVDNVGRLATVRPTEPVVLISNSSVESNAAKVSGCSSTMFKQASSFPVGPSAGAALATVVLAVKLQSEKGHDAHTLDGQSPSCMKDNLKYGVLDRIAPSLTVFAQSSKGMSFSKAEVENMPPTRISGNSLKNEIESLLGANNAKNADLSLEGQRRPSVNLCQSGHSSAGHGTNVSAVGSASTNLTYAAQWEMENESQILIKIGAHRLVSEAFNQIEGAVFEKQKGWLVPLKQLDRTKQALCCIRGLNVTWEGPPLVESIVKSAMKRSDDSSRYRVLTVQPGGVGSESLEERMMHFQREGVKFALRHGGKAIIGDEMGLGKTVQACAILKCYEDKLPALIVVPSSLRQPWADALFQWLKAPEDEVTVVYKEADLERARAPGVRYIIISYDLLSRGGVKSKIAHIARGRPPRLVVLDEAHYIKNHKCQRTKEALPLVQGAEHALLLTGTPAMSRPTELFTLLQALLPDAKLRLKDFEERYCRIEPRFQKCIGAQNPDELNKLLLGTVMIRRRKAEVLSQLPPKRRQQVYLTVEAEAATKLRAMSDELNIVKSLVASCAKDRAGAGLSGLHQEAQLKLNQLYCSTAKIKVPAVQQYVNMLLDSGEKFLIFAHHRDLLDGIECAVNKSKDKVRFIRIDGSTPASKRGDLVSAFQEDVGVRVAILGIKAASVGLTLTAASTVVFSELSWVPGDITQAEDRAHRIGQSSSVNVHFLLLRGSIDDIMWETLQSKLDTVGQVLDGKGAQMQVDSTRHLDPHQSTLACNASRADANTHDPEQSEFVKRPSAALSTAGAKLEGGKRGRPKGKVAASNAPASNAAAAQANSMLKYLSPSTQNVGSKRSSEDQAAGLAKTMRL